MLPLAGFALTAQAASSQEQQNIARAVPNLNVRGRAELSKPADELRINIGVVTQHEEATEALRINSRRMREVITALEGAGLDEDDYETGRFQIHPVYSQRPQPRGQVSEPWHPEIVAYRVTNVVHIKTSQIDAAGEIIDAANEAGANSIDSIRFTLSDPRTHRAEAIRVATENAVTDAQNLADAAGLRLVRIVSITLDEQPQVEPFRQEMMMRSSVAADAAEPTPIRPGDVTVTANVNIVYEIAPL